MNQNPLGQGPLPPGLPAFIQALLLGGQPLGALAQSPPLLGGPGGVPQQGGGSTPQGFGGSGLVQGGATPPSPWALFTGQMR